MSTIPASPNPNQALWEKGDFTRIAATMRESADGLLDPIGITPGLRVLDLGCGDGTTAVPAAKRGADVLGVDIARNLVEAGNRRVAAEGLTNCRFEQGDATNLQGLANQSFDLLISFFGAMFAPKPFDVAAEMVRVVKKGGRIVMGNWIPGDPTLVAQILKITPRFTPPPPEGFVSPMTWGLEDQVLARFARAGIGAGQISFARDTLTFRHPGKPETLLAIFRDYYGPTMNAYQAAEKDGRSVELTRELETLFIAQNKSDRPDTTVIAATFLRVTVTV